MPALRLARIQKSRLTTRMNERTIPTMTPMSPPSVLTVVSSVLGQFGGDCRAERTERAGMVEKGTTRRG